MRKLLLSTIFATACVSFLSSALAQERMRIAWAGSTPSNTPIWVADQKGFFKKNGLNAEVIAISASRNSGLSVSSRSKSASSRT